MQHYLSQLLHDIKHAQQNLTWPSEGKELSIFDWKSPGEEEATAPVWNLSEWVGITPDMLPPANMFSEEDVHKVLEARKYDDDWMKYYLYHLDKNYDDENGNPYDYGFEEDDDEEEDDTWWRR
jgi:hypothetical protein